MRWEDLVFVIILMISGEICAEEGHCDFPNVENGMLAQYYYTFKNFYFPMRLHKKLSFYCLAGYTTELGKQKAKTKCTTEGWNPAPRCIRKCSKPELSNGYISDVKVLYKIGDTMRYSCAAGYKTTGGKHVEEVRCLAHGWSSLPACRKERETCLSPELHNGNYYTTQKTFNVKDKVLYECAAGFYTAGGKQVEEVECLPHGWALTPQCTRSTCPTLRLIENGYFYPVKQTYEEGDVVQFFCHENYYLSGSDLIQCYTFGWYPESPFCEGRRNRCPPPPVPLNSKNQSYSQTYRQGEIVRIECELNFELQGPAEMHCENGKWTEPPKCVEKKGISCEQPPSIQNGAPIQNSRAYSCGDKVEYRCETGYQLRGPKEIECHHGQWSSPPECVKQTENCGPPPNITNGAVVGGVLASYTLGSSVEYRCNEYYLLNGSKTSHCEKGVWSSPPVCMEPCTLSEDDMTKNNIEMKWKTEGKIFHGDLIEFMCKEGYGLSPSTLPSELSVKCHRGQVKYPFCIRKERRNGCTSPPMPVNSKVQTHSTTHDHGEIVHIECERNFEIRGSREIRCEHGEWTEPPQCIEKERITCEQPPSIQNGAPIQNSRAYSHGDKVEYRCDTGYQLQGPKEIECHHGQWSSPPDCVKQVDNCGPPPNITNGSIVGGVLANYTPGSSVEYRCNEHYQLNGSKMSYCEKGVWSSPPVCMEPCILNEDDMTKNHIEIKFKNEGKVFHGDWVEFMCKEGYELSPSTHLSELSVKCHRGELKYPFCIRKERRNECPPPPMPVNSKIHTHHHHHEEVVHIECERNFELRGSHEMRCEHGEWTEPPQCVEKEKITCEQPPSIQNGAPIQNSRSYSHGDKVEYRCDTGYQLRGPKEIECRHGQWSSPPECVKQTENCGPPPNITNGVIVGEVLASYTPGSSVEYRCNEHHRLNGSKMSYCEKRAWSSPPVCMEPCIPNEDDMTKNHIEIKFKNEGKIFHGDLIEFMCKEGYDLPPSELSVKCHRGELKYPSCIRKERRNGCPPPPIPVNSKIESHSIFHDHDEEVVHIECERHFELRGSHKMRCEHGEWTEPPKCVEKEKITCEQPPSIQNGALIQNSRSYSHGDKVEYRCDTGYQLQGPKEIECHHGQWSSPPECVKQIENCGPPPNITNGVIVGGVLANYTPGSSVEYRCNEHYRLNGSAMSYCEKRAWSSPPVCMEPCTLSEDDMTKNNIEVKYKNEGKVLHGDLIEFRCKEGYELSPSTHSSELSVKCHRGGLKYPSCIRKERRNGCPPPPIPVHSKIESHSTFHDHDEEVVHIECERHFELRGSHEMRCEHGEWTEPPKCVEERRVTCEHPPSIENGSPIQNSRAYSCGDKVEYHCERGYHLIGPKEISCHHGQWSSPPECVEHSKHCGPPPSITNGTVVGGVLESYKHGDSVEYRCNEYYLLSGTKTSHCRKGEWSSPPVCMEPCTMNEDDMTKNNIEIKWKHEGKILHGDLIEFKCKQGYELSPSTLLSELSVQCRGGQVKYPSCNRKESKGRCAPPPLIKNGVIISSTVTTYETGSSVEYRCFEHHFLHGHKEAHCVEGIWTPPPVCLEPCTLSHHEMEKNNLHLKWHFDDRPFILHGEYVEFHCKRDTFLVESSVIRDEVRVKCDKGYLKYPRCVERER